MQSIAKEYLVLFSAISAAEESLTSLHHSLIEAQQLAEELYISESEDEEEKIVS